MVRRNGRWALRHRGIVTVLLLTGLMLNLLVIGRVAPPDLQRHGDLPLAASCQGGGLGCAETPLIPPPAVGMPHMESPPPAVFGAPLLVEPAVRSEVREPLPLQPERPPRDSFSV